MTLIGYHGESRHQHVQSSDSTVVWQAYSRYEHVWSPYSYKMYLISLEFRINEFGFDKVHENGKQRKVCRRV
jgi:hypothetical protein